MLNITTTCFATCTDNLIIFKWHQFFFYVSIWLHLVDWFGSLLLHRFDRENSNLQNHLSQSCGNFDIEDSSSEGEEGLLYDDLGNGNRLSLISSDNSVSFGSISNIKSKWEDDKNAAPLSRKEELARQRKEEIQMIRAKQCQVGWSGRSGRSGRFYLLIQLQHFLFKSSNWSMIDGQYIHHQSSRHRFTRCEQLGKHSLNRC